MATPSARRTRIYGAIGFAGLSLVSLVGYVFVAWGLRSWLTPTLITGGSIAAVSVPAVGMALGRALTTGRPRDERIFALATGGALGMVGLFVGEVAYITLSMFANL
ncbi:hypothetical protein ACIBO2_18825 [Nonomuraea sp. NPDC050022]|uniref:hypothetical protein n=1 Tax=Nonomuraea sp. NPDC050022 TaxID=3364358 RepID=UPI00379C6470